MGMIKGVLRHTISFYQPITRYNKWQWENNCKNLSCFLGKWPKSDLELQKVQLFLAELAKKPGFDSNGL